MPFNTQYSQQSPGTLVSELDLSVRVAMAVATSGASVFASKRGPLGRRFVSSGVRFRELYGAPDPSVGFGHDCSLSFLEQSTQFWGNRVVNGALHAGTTYFVDRNSALADVPAEPRRIVQKLPIGSTAGFEAGGTSVVLLSFAGDLITGNKFNMSITDGATTSAISEVTYTTSHNNTMSLIAAEISTTMALFHTGGQCVVHQETSGNYYIIAIYLPEGTTLSFLTPAVTAGASQTTAVVDEEAKLFDVYAENPGLWGDDVGIRLTNFDAGQRSRWRITLGGPLSAGHTLLITVNDTDVSTAYTTNSDTTLANFAAAIAAVTDYIESAEVTEVPGALNNDRVITVVAKDPGPTALVLSGAQVTGTSAPAIIAVETLTGILPTHEFDLEVYERPNVRVPVERYRCTMAKGVNSNGRQTGLDIRVNGVSDNTGTGRTVGGSDRIRVVMPSYARDFTFSPTVMGSVYAVDSTINFLHGGDDGAAVLNSQISAGWDTFKDELIPVRILINCGYTDVSVQQKMVAVAEYRLDAMAVLDTPADRQTAQAAYDYRMLDMNIDSSFGALYTPDLLIADDDSDELRYIPPSGHVAAAYAYSDSVAAVWFAPAGLNRGRLHRVRGLRVDYDLGARELLSPVGVNCIIDRLGSGPTIWDEETLQYKKSVLSGVHARRLLSSIELAYRNALDYSTLFEPNNPFTRFNAKQVGEKLLAPIKRDGGLYFYEIVCDEENNPPEIIDQEMVRVDVYLQIVRTAKRVLMRMVLTPTGANVEVLIGLVNNQSNAAIAA